MNSALRRMGYTKDQMCPHGFRSSASTILNERGFDEKVIEVALAHQEEDEVRRAYNRAKYWPQRRLTGEAAANEALVLPPTDEGSHEPDEPICHVQKGL
jgi:integrase